jgi:hypothetical protein
MKKTPVLILVGMALILLICCASAGFADEGSINQVNSEPLDMEILSPEGNYVSSTGKIPISLQSAGGSIVTVKIYPMDSEYLSMGSFRLDVRDMVVEYHAAVLPAVQMMMDERVEEPVTDEIGEEIATENTTETIELPSLPSKMFSETIGQTGRWLYELTLQPGRYILLIQAEGNMMRSEEYALSVTVTSMERATEFLEKLEEAESSYITPAVLAPIQWPLSMY